MTVRPAGSSALLQSALLPFVLVSFAANSLITRYVVAHHLLDAGLLTAVRFLAGAAALVAVSLVRDGRPVVGRANLLPALWLGVYAVCISYGYSHIGAAAGTFVFYAAVLLTLTAGDVMTNRALPVRRGLAAGVSLAGIAVLAATSGGNVTVLGVVLLAATGIAWGLYTAAGRSTADPRVATTGHFLVLGAALVLPAAGGVIGGLRITVTGVLWAVAMGAVTTAIAYVAWYACQRKISATTAGSVQLVIPVLTSVGAIVLLGERFSPSLLVAAVLVGTGLWWGRPRAIEPESAVSQGLRWESPEHGRT